MFLLNLSTSWIVPTNPTNDKKLPSVGITINLGSLIQNLDSTDIINTIKFTVIIIIATFLIILGSWKIKKYTLKRLIQ